MIKVVTGRLPPPFQGIAYPYKLYIILRLKIKDNEIQKSSCLLSFLPEKRIISSTQNKPNDHFIMPYSLPFSGDAE